MAGQPTPGQVKAWAREGWDSQAEGYVKEVVPHYQPLYRLIADRARARPGERVLDIGTGPGRPALDIAPQVAPSGHVLGIDLSPRMVALARREALRRGLANVEFREGDMEGLDLPAGSFHLAVSNYAIFMRPEAFPRVYRLLRPGGRFVLTAWGDEEAMLAHSLALRVMARFLPPQSPQRDIYALGRPGALKAALEAAGFNRVEAEPVPLTYRFDSLADYAHYIWNLIGRFLPPQVQQRAVEIKADIALAAARFAGEKGVEIPFAAMLGVGYK